MNALTNQEAKIVMRQFIDRNRKAFAAWVPTPLASKAWDFLGKVEQKTDIAHSDSVQRLRE